MPLFAYYITPPSAEIYLLLAAKNDGKRNLAVTTLATRGIEGP